MKRCPFCAEEIQDAAIVCKHCGRDLADPVPIAAPQSQPTTTPKLRSLLGWLAGIVGTLVVIGWCATLLDSGSTPPQPLSEADRADVMRLLSDKYLQVNDLHVDHGVVVAMFERSDDSTIPPRVLAEKRLVVIREALRPYGYRRYRVDINGPKPTADLIRRYGSMTFSEGGSFEWTPVK